MKIQDAADIPATANPMKWNDKELKTIGDVCEAMASLQNREQAVAFLEVARAADPKYADHNIGYLMGYFSRPRWAQLSEWFGISHPVFGNQFDLTEDEIFQMGVERGKEMVRRAKD